MDVKDTFSAAGDLNVKYVPSSRIHRTESKAVISRRNEPSIDSLHRKGRFCSFALPAGALSLRNGLCIGN